MVGCHHPFPLTTSPDGGPITWFEPFNYPDGPLPGNGPWITFSPPDADVESDGAVMSSGATSTADAIISSFNIDPQEPWSLQFIITYEFTAVTAGMTFNFQIIGNTGFCADVSLITPNLGVTGLNEVLIDDLVSSDSSGPVAFAYNTPHTVQLVFDGTDLIGLLNAVEVCRITGADLGTSIQIQTARIGGQGDPGNAQWRLDDISLSQ